MTIQNNFDNSSSGVNIECAAFYDTDRSRYDFEENFKVIQFSGYRTTSVLYYVGNGNVPDNDDISFSVKGKKSAKVDYLATELNYTKKEIRSWDIDTIDTEILGQYEDVNLINYARDRMPDAPNGLEFVPNKNLITVASCGHSQGDYAVIIYCPDDLKKTWGNEPKQNELQRLFNHYLWDAPIFALFTINDVEYRYDDMPDYDEYKWERDKFLKYVSEQSGVPIDTLEPLCPEDPSWS